LSARNCQIPTQPSQNLEVAQQIWTLKKKKKKKKTSRITNASMFELMHQERGQTTRREMSLTANANPKMR
jgi:hypothetical protein